MDEVWLHLTKRCHLPQQIIEKISNQRKQRLTDLENEQEYSRHLLGIPGYEPPYPELWHDAVTILMQGKNLLLKGPTGSGKTKLAETLSYFFGQPLYTVNCSVDLDIEALLGYKTLVQSDGQPVIEFVAGPVVKAMRAGHLLYIDEINMAKPETLPILNSVLDYRRSLVNPLTGETIKAGQGFGVIAAMNEGYIGTVPLNEALKNRFVVLDIPYLQGERLKQLLLQHSRQKNDTIIDRFVQLSSDLMIQAETGQIADEAVSIRALIDACDLSLYMPPLRAIERAIVGKVEDEREKMAIINVAETLF